jgi:signal transduction histidine kinase
MTVRGEVIGTLAVQDEAEQPLTAEDRELFESISVQVAEALESARLLEQTQKNASELESVAQVSAVASTILERQDLLQTVATLTKERFDLYFVGLFALDKGSELLSWAGGTRLPVAPAEALPPPVIELSATQSLVASAARSRRPIITNDVTRDPRFLPVSVLPDTRSEMTIPLIVGDELLGVLDLQSDVRNHFTEDAVRIHTTLATQVAVAWKNANLYAEQLETAKRLREVDRLKSEFMASMSHELRTPLNSIIGFSDVLLEGMDGPLTERMTEDVTLIRDSGRHLRELISEILDMSKIEAGMMELRYEVVNVPQIAREIVATARSLSYPKELDIQLNLDPKLETIEADRTRLIQILLNLMSNAIKFTNVGKVSLIMSDTGENLQVAVEDTGIGIEEEDIPIIFEQFRQIDGSLTRKAGGTGLGMPISKSLVELHGGEMWVESQPGVGSTFGFTIPKRRSRAQKPATGPLALLN